MTVPARKKPAGNGKTEVVPKAMLISVDMPIIDEFYRECQADVEAIKNGTMPNEQAETIVKYRREMRNAIGHAISRLRLGLILPSTRVQLTGDK